MFKFLAEIPIKSETLDNWEKVDSNQVVNYSNTEENITQTHIKTLQELIQIRDNQNNNQLNDKRDSDNRTQRENNTKEMIKKSNEIPIQRIVKNEIKIEDIWEEVVNRAGDA